MAGGAREGRRDRGEDQPAAAQAVQGLSVERLSLGHAAGPEARPACAAAGGARRADGGPPKPSETARRGCVAAAPAALARSLGRL